VGITRLSVIVALAANLAAMGFVPAEHFHHSTATRQATVHSHIGVATTSHPPRAGACCFEDDDHDTAVDLDRVMGAGPNGPSVGQPAVLFEQRALPSPRFVMDAVSAWTPDDAPSPPPRPTAPRAPPA
jgi:hypothetical protein